MVTIEIMQNAIIALGWSFKEIIYNDGLLGDCFIEFTQDKKHQWGTYPLPQDCLGWGRYRRQVAWEMAYVWIVKGIRDKTN